MKESYEVEVETKHDEITVSLLKDDYSRLNSLLESARTEAKKTPVDAIVVFLSLEDELVSIWEFSLDKETAESTIATAKEQVERYVKKLEGKNGN